MKVFRKEINQFKYTPRYYKGDDNPYKFKNKFDEFRTATAPKKSTGGFSSVFGGDIKNKFNLAITEWKSSNYSINRTILLIVVILTLLFLYVIDFDLSIFTKK